MMHACHIEHQRSGTTQGAKRLSSRDLGVPPAQMQPGSRFPLQVLGRITGLWAFRFNRSRGYGFHYLSIA
jgi:hypothetical protein